MLGLAVGAVLWPMTAAAGEVTSLPQFSDVRPSDWAY